MSMTLFERAPRFDPAPDALEGLRSRLEGELGERLRPGGARLERVETGQGLTFRLGSAAERAPSHLVKVVRNRGYPSAGALREVSALLSDAGVAHPRLVLHDASGALAPYGLLVFEWVEGEPLSRENALRGTALEAYVAAAVQALRAVHAIALPCWGALGGGPRFASFAESFADLDRVVARSFGDVLTAEHSLLELEEAGLVARGFVAETSEWASECARALPAPEGAVLLHGDAFATNLIRTERGDVWVDWDEARAGWWVSELARLSYWLEAEPLVTRFAEAYGPGDLSGEDLDRALRIEHTRLDLRRLFALGWDARPRDALRAEARSIATRVEQRRRSP